MQRSPPLPAPFTPACAPTPHAALSMYLVLSISCDGLAALVSTALRLPISPHFDSPYGCTSGALPASLEHMPAWAMDVVPLTRSGSTSHAVSLTQ